MAKLEPVSSVQDQAEAAKQKGNDHFKKKEYAESIGCYSHAHILLPSSAIYPLNRAQAYINLSKFSDAERDCSTSISLDPKNPKAWFRRGIARRSLADWAGSRADFTQVLILDRSMEAGVKTELEKVEVAEKAEKEKAKGKQNKKISVVSQPKASPESTTIKPIAIPIKMTYPTSDSSATDVSSIPLISPRNLRPNSSPVSSASASSSPSPSPPPVSLKSHSSTDDGTPALSGSNPPKDPTSAIFPSFPTRSKPKPESELVPGPIGKSGFSALKAARSSKGIIAKVAGPTGRDGLSLEGEDSEDDDDDKEEKEEDLPRPESVHSLVRALKSLNERRSWLVLKNMPVSRLPTLVGSSLEPPLLDHLFVLLESKNPKEKTTKKALAEQLGSLKRFGLNLCMLERGSERWKIIQETYGA
ncbi:translocon at the outer membrane of chloroplasts 64-iii [Phaffia rhodozyma]|uniref:RNA polymerase II-associated protein 3 n=1 Tax=Phaffia rhodozyma TaxID=264483 RepID=A0A0F7SVB5_PHARH|nr:translocon at the outer membrane of chloroplasts 64-iii [Phaffia rhodozyma]